MSTHPSPAAPPRTWLILAEKGGDNAQVLALGDALPWSCETRQVYMREEWLFGKPRVGAHLDHLDLARCDPLEPPWPDLVITMGRRTAMVAFWLQERSGGKTRIVLLGKPSGWMERFDLVIGSAEIQLPPLDNVLRIGLPLLRADPKRVAAAAESWRPRLAALPRPLVGLLVGGPTGPFIYDRSTTHELIGLAAQVRREGGTPFVTTSRRTPEAVARTLQEKLPEGSELYLWKPDAALNPYLGLLGLADAFVVTADSVSMAVEVARLGRPLAILALPTGPLGGLDLRRRAFTRWLFQPPHAGLGGRLRKTLALAAFRSGVLTHTRDFAALHDWMLARRIAVWAHPGETRWTKPTQPVGDDLEAAVARVRGLFSPDEVNAPRRVPSANASTGA